MIYKLKIATSSDSEPQEFELNRKKTLLGRREGNHIRIKERYVSSDHAVFYLGGDDELFLEDCGSRNGIYINGVKLEGVSQLYSGDRLSIGELLGEVVAEVAPQELAVESSLHHEHERTLDSQMEVDSAEDSHLVQLQREVERLAALKEELQTETSNLVETKERLAKDHDDLSEDLWDTRKKIEGLIDLECELQESVSELQVNTMSRKKVFSKGDDLKCAATERRICRDLIRWLENLEEAQKVSQPNLLTNRTTRKLSGLEGNFVDFLAEYSVKKIDFEPGAEISMLSRSKIQLIAVDEIEDAKLRKEVASQIARLGKDVVLRTISPGFVYEDNGKEHVLRKAEVIVA